MQINLTDVLCHDKIFEKLEQKLLIETIQLGKDIYQVLDGIDIKLDVNKIGNKEVLLDGFLETTLALKCDRCNEPVKYHLGTDFSKAIKVDSVVEDNDDNFMDGYDLDLEKLILNEVYLNFPMKVLCKEDCKGICVSCGNNLNVLDCNCEKDLIDPRLSGLKALFDENFKEV